MWDSKGYTTRPIIIDRHCQLTMSAVIFTTHDVSQHRQVNNYPVTDYSLLHHVQLYGNE